MYLKFKIMKTKNFLVIVFLLIIGLSIQAQNTKKSDAKATVSGPEISFDKTNYLMFSASPYVASHF